MSRKLFDSNWKAKTEAGEILTVYKAFRIVSYPLIFFFLQFPQILVHLGVLTKEAGLKIAENAFSGGPLGELVQWSDLISTLHVLGHHLHLSASLPNLKKWVLICMPFVPLWNKTNRNRQIRQLKPICVLWRYSSPVMPESDVTIVYFFVNNLSTLPVSSDSLGSRRVAVPFDIR